MSHYFAQHHGYVADSYTGPVTDGYGRTGRVANVPVQHRQADAWLDHLTLPGGWYATVQARPKPAPYRLPNGVEATAISVARSMVFGQRGGWEVGDYVGDQVIVLVHDGHTPDEVFVMRRGHFEDGSGKWRHHAKGWSVLEFRSWNGVLPELDCSVHAAGMVAWLDTVEAPPQHNPGDPYLYLTPAEASALAR